MSITIRIDGIEYLQEKGIAASSRCLRFFDVIHLLTIRSSSSTTLLPLTELTTEANVMALLICATIGHMVAPYQLNS